ncbi:mitochondrial import receptor subunit TOM7 homolog [Erinaceus europaeus]|uniref:Mitochondrial import receptor subunit TOM7 homolog n=2 Tax=Erinaceus europaeus TaxID=9365 RepID=A0ABM3XTE1_ERIEU|nr:mitochondrial import receptor subunit TOM7 homolog [Erinaceus europaeus]
MRTSLPAGISDATTAVAAFPRAAVAATMAKLSKEAKQRLQQLFKGGQFAIRWGFIPLVIYLGFKRGADPGMPEPSVLSLLWG